MRPRRRMDRRSRSAIRKLLDGVIPRRRGIGGICTSDIRAPYAAQRAAKVGDISLCWRPAPTILPVSTGSRSFRTQSCRRNRTAHCAVEPLAAVGGGEMSPESKSIAGVTRHGEFPVSIAPTRTQNEFFCRFAPYRDGSEHRGPWRGHPRDRKNHAPAARRSDCQCRQRACSAVPLQRCCVVQGILVPHKRERFTASACSWTCRPDACRAIP